MTDLPATVFVLYGATGDLARRMVLPAFWELAQRGLLPQDWRLVGNGRGDVSHEEFAGRVHDALTEFGPFGDGADDGWADFAGRLRFAGGGFDESDPGSLLDVLAEARAELGGRPQLVHYLATPPEAFAKLTRGLQRHGLTEGSRVVYEKPYGTSPQGFRELDELVLSVLAEDQVFRIDHFLGKEGTQDLHVLRFANGLFGHVWSREHVAQVQIDVPEDLDVAGRAEFYDATGAALDMLVTHLFQLAAEVAMEPPASFSPADLQAAREGVLAAFRPLDPAEVVLGQFDGYTDLDGVADDSRTDTYVAARLWVDTDRWRGVPFVLRTGKRMAAGEQRVSLLLRRPDGPVTDVPGHGNVLSLSLSGSGAVDLQVVAKQPGPDLALAAATATLQLADVPGGTPLPPYVSLLHDVLVGDRSLFTSSDGLAHAWRAFAPLQERPPRVYRYAPGSWGPVEADALAEPAGWLLGS
ncbi:glucose-6-phosphate dehydrogenase (NADP(+)) [Geodermatophilus sp. DSM 44513]|uniref:glucose-6-phosphate dehydrogenase n=1 Tax=Geodermatophilus sp. DSM 44513 TaxID=1528104 RepID=UPI0012872498|nr:glucose-6-phosphate dehydrogenase (NADP(+)) [Geodermatophilus sp. DSM 44513]WNV76293.1 glucose-6-phosphate dehydrogenase (NADP(+)) [Geodermatophilus sp. DSM 44513]